MDPQLGRWHVVDAMAERYTSQSPYSYAGNDPAGNYDIMGLTYDPRNNFINGVNTAPHQDGMGGYGGGGFGGGIAWNNGFGRLWGMHSQYGSSNPFIQYRYDSHSGTYRNHRGEEVNSNVAINDAFSHTATGNKATLYGSDAQNFVRDIANQLYFEIHKFGDGKSRMLTSTTPFDESRLFGDMESGYSYVGGYLGVFLGEISLNEYNALKTTVKFITDGKRNNTLLCIGAAFAVEDIYNNLSHSHTQYRTTGGKIKNIRKANGQFRSANAAQAARVSTTVKIIGNVGTAYMTGNAAYNITNGNGTAFDYADATVGTLGLLGAGASYIGYAVPVVGQFVALYSLARVSYDLGATYGPIHRIWGN